jgi:spermidine synthase
VGAWYWGNRNVNLDKTAKIGSLFLTIALLGVLSVWFINLLLPMLYASLPAMGLGRKLTHGIVFLHTIAMLFVPTFFMGGVFPLLATHYIRAKAGINSGIGRIYAIETIGSAVGGLVAGFWLIGFVGLMASIWVASGISLLLGMILLIYKPMPLDQPVDEPAPVISKSKKKIAAETKIDFGNLPLYASFVSGFSVIGLQVVWFRAFRIYLTNSAYTFSLIASMVIVGLFVGSWLYSLYAQRITNQAKLLFRLLLLMGLLAAIGCIVLVKLPALVMFPFEDLNEYNAIRILLIPFLSALLIIVPVTIGSGFMFPFVCSLYAKNLKQISSSIGNVLLANTAGSVVGPLLAAFVLIPLVGAGLSVLVIASFLIITAFFIGHKLLPKATTQVWISGVVAVVLIGASIALPRLKLLPPSFSKFQKELLAYNETTEGTFIVGEENKQGSKVLSTYVNNSAVIGSTYDAIKVVKMVGHLPFFAGIKCENALVVGFGIGVTTSALASHPEVKTIDCVELVAGLKDAAHFYADLNHGIQNDPRLKVYQGDGRHFLLASTKTYDLITTDPTHPILGSASLYTKEYFELCRAHLNPGGMISQYLPLHKLLPEDFKGILATFQTVFPECTVWLGQYHAVLLGFTNQAKIDFGQWAQHLETMQRDVWFYNNPYALASCLALDGDEIKSLGKDLRILTDDKPYTEFCSLKSFDTQNLPINLLMMNTKRKAIERVFINIPDPALMQHFIEGNRLMTEGLRLMLKGDRQGFVHKMQEAIAINPDNQELPLLLQLNMN